MERRRDRRGPRALPRPTQRNSCSEQRLPLCLPPHSAATRVAGETWSFNKSAGLYKKKRGGIGGGPPATIQCPKLTCLSDLNHLTSLSLSIPVKLPNGNKVDLGKVRLLPAGWRRLPEPSSPTKLR